MTWAENHLETIFNFCLVCTVALKIFRAGLDLNDRLVSSCVGGVAVKELLDLRKLSVTKLSHRAEYMHPMPLFETALAGKCKSE